MNDNELTKDILERSESLEIIGKGFFDGPQEKIKEWEEFFEFYLECPRNSQDRVRAIIAASQLATQCGIWSQELCHYLIISTAAELNTYALFSAYGEERVLNMSVGELHKKMIFSCISLLKALKQTECVNLLQAGEKSGEDVFATLYDRTRQEWGNFMEIIGKKAEPPVSSLSEYLYRTSQEIDVLERSACDKGEGFVKDTQRGALIYERPNASHRVELRTEPDNSDGEEVELDTLSWLTKQQNADFCYALLYVCQILAPPSPLPSNRAAVEWVDLDDIAEKIGYNLDRCTQQEREALRAQVWQFLLYGSRATVIGRRRGTYWDKRTNEIIETRIESPPWSIVARESPVQRALFGEVPRRAQLVVSKEWEPLLTSPQLAEYLPLAHLVAQIPTNQAAGAWARVIAPCLASFWRRHPRETMHKEEVKVKAATNGSQGENTVAVWEPSMRPTRRELLCHFLPKKSPPLEILASSDPRRAVKYWRDALGLLCESGFLAREGEPARTVGAQLEGYGRKNWQEAWLDEKVDLRPGPTQAPHVQGRANALPAAKPRKLGKSRRKPGRPKKVSA